MRTSLRGLTRSFGSSRKENVVIKKIHYCWFGGKPLGDLELRCIASWRKFLPEFEIIRWDESNFNIDICPYAKEAYARRKWAFVSDYARFWILDNYGGLYFDTDVELIKPIDDLIDQGPFFGIETDYGGSYVDSLDSGLFLSVNPGLGMYSNPGDIIIRDVLASMENDHFILQNGEENLETIVTRLTKILIEHGLSPISGVQRVAGALVLPAEFLNPKDYLTGDINLTENTRAIHHFTTSWLSEQDKYESQLRGRLIKHGLSLSMSNKVAALVRVIRFRDQARVSRWLHNVFNR